MMLKEKLKQEIDAVENEQTLELVQQLIHDMQTSSNEIVAKYSKEEQIKALEGFSGTFDTLKIDEVENMLRSVRKGRRGLWNAV